MYKSFKLLASSWDGVYEDMLNKQKMISRKRTQEIDNINKIHSNELLKFQCEKNSFVDLLRNETIKREQDLLDSVTGLSNNMNNSKRYWANNLNDLYIFLQEQKQNMTNYRHWRQISLQNIDIELENSLNSGLNDILSNPPLSTQRERECYSASTKNCPPPNINNVNRDLVEIINALSPIHHRDRDNQNKNLNNLPRNNNLKAGILELKNMIQYKDDINPSSKRNYQKNERENLENISANSSKIYADLSFFNKNDPNFNNVEYPDQEDSKISIKKQEPEWDSTLEDEESLDNISELGRAMELLHKAHVFDSV